MTIDPKWRRRMAHQAIRAREKAELDRLRLALEHAKAQRRARIRNARALCKRAKETLRVKLKERRRLLRLEALAAAKAERSTCRARRAAAKRSGDRDVSGAAGALSAARSFNRSVSRRAQAKPPTAALGRQHRQESDEEAARDLPAELHGIWQKMRGRFKGSAKMSRAEQFLHWAHENPGEVVALQSDAADREVEQLIREHAAQHEKARRKPTRAQIEAELKREGVPF